MTPGRSPDARAGDEERKGAARDVGSHGSTGGGRDRDGSPVIPERSADDVDVGWGERPDTDDDERFLRDVPPHW